MGPSYLATRGSTTVSRRCERRQGARLVLFHEPVTDHVGSKNGCKTAPDASFGHLSVSFQKERGPNSISTTAGCLLAPTSELGHEQPVAAFPW
jgi:hypothetical protein